MAEAIGTLIQNIKYISIYKYTAEGWGRGWTLGVGFPAEGPGRQGWDHQEVRNVLHLICTIEGKKMGRYLMRTPTCSHTYEPNVGLQGGLGREH